MKDQVFRKQSGFFVQMLCSNDCLQIVLLNSQRKQMLKKLFSIKKGTHEQQLILSMIRRQQILQKQEDNIIDKYRKSAICSRLYRKTVTSFCKNVLNHKSQRFICLMSIKQLQRFSLRKKNLINQLQSHIGQDFISFSYVAKSTVGLYRACLNSIVEQIRGGRKNFLMEGSSQYKNQFNYKQLSLMLPSLSADLQIKTNKIKIKKQQVIKNQIIDLNKQNPKLIKKKTSIAKSLQKLEKNNMLKVQQKLQKYQPQFMSCKSLHKNHQLLKFNKKQDKHKQIKQINLTSLILKQKVQTSRQYQKKNQSRQLQNKSFTKQQITEQFKQQTKQMKPLIRQPIRTDRKQKLVYKMKQCLINRNQTILINIRNVRKKQIKQIDQKMQFQSQQSRINQQLQLVNCTIQ